ncbi:SusC/RagA family TonB-linked outer membrane protein [Pedobacter caeni]|uniref:TonB-linked outer membrane protein, SusC/RagA family n=1 Tax=Pedobacter caeni TaxID=288992 RepID=A0A1M5GDK3_9SPHI|nr:TonB-dependent receptor [Pedobacter caeni]SHG01776.1 TonB-linked outer membrane protein, SusC/RagA family [Pedobacter caeni]
MVRILHLLLIFLILSSSLVFSRAQSYALLPTANHGVSRPAARQFKPLKEALKELEQSHKVSIMFDSKLAEKVRVYVQENPGKETIETVLTNMLTPVNINYKKIAEQFYVINFKESKTTENTGTTGPKEKDNNEPATENQTNQLQPARLITVSGMVTDGSNGEVLPGVSIKLKGATTSSSTDGNGKYSIRVPEKGTLVFSYISYVTREVPITGNPVLNVQLLPDQQKLNEVVVVGVGYGTQQKKNLTGSIASISAKNIKDIPVTSFENAIQGQIAGVQVQEPSGEPGAATTIRVRGIGSISAGNEPLYVVDGFPVSKNVESATQGDVSKRTVAFRPAPANPLGTISPGDIQSVEVLKDAAAAAIYGSRGSNGVIIITTKKGKRDGTSTVSFDSYYGVQTLANKVDLMNSAELTRYVLDAKNNAYIQDFPNANINDPNSVRYTRSTNTSYYIPSDFSNPTGTDTDWQDILFRNSSIQTYNLSLSGGAEKLGYYISGNYYNQNGIIDKTGFKRYSFRINIESDPVKNLRVGANINPSFTDQAKGSTSAPYFADPPGAVYTALVNSPTVRPYLPDGSINQTNNQSHLNTENGTGTNMTASSNPLAVVKHIHDDLSQFRTFANAYAEYSIFEGLKYKLMLGTDINNYNRKYYREKAFLDRAATVGVPYGQSNSSLETNWLAENTLSYNKVFGRHSLSAVAGYTAQKNKIRNNQVQAENFPDDLVQTVSGGQVTGGTATEEEWSLVSYLGRVNYAFMDRYLLTATIRSDRASRFGEGNKVGYFPSFSAGWRLSDEAFMKGLKFINDFKIRGSWGKTGNFLIPNYASIGLLNPYNYVFGNVVTNGVAPSTPSNPSLTWEKNRQVDIGLDMSLFNNRIFASFDWYNKLTSDLLLNVQVPAIVGYGNTNPLRNVGEVENKGFEASLTTHNLVGDFTWSTDMNFSANKNKVLKLGASGDPILSSGGAGIRHITRIGDPIGSYYGYVVEGIYQTQQEINNAPKDKLAPKAAPGDFRFKDVNGDGIIDASDRTVIGNYQPDYTYGITNRFSYKKIELSFLIQGVQGSEVLNLTRRHLGNGEANTNSYAFENNRWISPEQPGDGKTPRADRLGDLHGFNNRPSTYQVENASYIRLRNVTVAYTLPEKIMGKYFSSFRLYVSGTNLFTKTDYVGYNPEVNNQSTASGVQGEDYGAYPLSRNFTFGINASFK